MEAAAAEDRRAGIGTSRLLAHCAGVERLTRGGRASARVRLESQLGDELARFLVTALAREEPPRSGC